MRSRVLVGSMLAGAACTSVNPAYETSSETTEVSLDTGETVGGGTTTIGETTLESTRGEATDGPDSDATTEPSESSSSSSGEPPPAIDLCRFDVYAINELGELYGLDPDNGELALVLEDPRLQSWAIATDPTTGLVYVNELGSPATMWRVDPFVAEIDAEPVMVEAEVFAEDVARATFHGDELWIGTDQTHRFVWLPPSGGSLGGDHTLQPFSRGGDMVFLETACAVVPTLDGMLYQACFPDSGLPPPEIPMNGLLGAQYNGIAVDAEDRVWLSNANPTTQLVPLDVSGDPWVVGRPVDFDITINDLATVVHPSDCR